MTSSKEVSSNGTSDIAPIEGSLEPRDTEAPQVQEEDPTVPLSLDMGPLTALSNNKTIRVPRNPHFTRKDVVQSFQSAFELIGGVPRLAIWANENETEFFKLYSRLLPSQASSALGESNTLKIELAVKPSPLDE
tara:strand:+ start:198 stop:599 length:402 start_codon:yes stop_codon:yes gene_type:complete